MHDGLLTTRPRPHERRGSPSGAARFLRALGEMLGAAGISYGRPYRSGRYRSRCSGAFHAEADVPPVEELCRRVPARIGRAVVYVEEHLGGPLSLDRLAEEAGLSKYYFARRFREEVGQTPWAYVRQARIERAKRLLAEGLAPAEVALATGFFDQSHLTNAMKELDGETPHRYQQEAARPEDAAGPNGDRAAVASRGEEASTADRKDLQE